MRTSFAKKLINNRNKRGWKQCDLALEANISTAAVSAYENGTRMPSTKSLDKICKTLGVSVDSMLSYSEPDFNTYTHVRIIFPNINGDIESITGMETKETINLNSCFLDDENKEKFFRLLKCNRNFSVASLPINLKA